MRVLIYGRAWTIQAEDQREIGFCLLPRYYSAQSPGKLTLITSANALSGLFKLADPRCHKNRHSFLAPRTREAASSKLKLSMKSTSVKGENAGISRWNSRMCLENNLNPFNCLPHATQLYLRILLPSGVLKVEVQSFLWKSSGSRWLDAVGNKTCQHNWGDAAEIWWE